MLGSVKNKIRWGTVFLFLLVVISGGFSIYYIVKIKNETKNIIQSNFDSLEYAHRMQADFDSVQTGHKTFIDSLSTHLKLQEGNITEQGEYLPTTELRTWVENLKIGETVNAQTFKFNISQILSVNMHAIKTKTETSELFAKEAMTLLITIVACIFIIGLTFAINFPGIITTPILKLTDSIKEIGSKNYKHRIHIQTKDEFGELSNAFNDMAERLEFFESSNLNKIIFEKGRAEAVINSLKDASIGIDKNEKVLFANNQALQLLGLQAKDIVGLNISDVAKRNDLFRFLLNEKGNIPFKIVVENRENYFIKEQVDITQDEASSRVIVLKNITSFKEIDAAKNNLIGTISHELKTPLASSDFSLRLLEDARVGSLSEEQKGLIQNLKQDNQSMLRILSELLNMAQVEAGKITMDLQMVTPQSIVEKSLPVVAAGAKEKSIHILKTIESDLPEIKVDADKLSWVLNNFLTNAIKYSPVNSSINLILQKSKTQISFIVIDEGPGIASEYNDQIFERYFKVPGYSDKNGSGIGLSICKEFIEAMGGNIWMKSRINQGSTFGFDIPVSV